MPRDPLAGFTVMRTPQTQPVPGRTDQVKNNAGGYVFAKNGWDKLEDFLALGTCSGSYYVGQDKLTTDNVQFLIDLAKSKLINSTNYYLDLVGGYTTLATAN